MTNPSIKTITITKFRNEIFDVINNVHKKGEEFIIEKSGVPVAKLVSINNIDYKSSINTEEFLQILKDTQGAWGGDDHAATEKKVEKKEKEYLEELKKALW